MTEIWFTKHNRNTCCIDLAACKYVGLDAPEALMRFISTMLGQRVPVVRDHFIKYDGKIRQANTILKDGVQHIIREAREADTYVGSIKSQHDSAIALALSAF